MYVRSAFVLAAALSAAGCASMHDSTVAAAPAAAVNGPDDASALYIQRVEQQARARGIGVLWVNPPHKRGRVVATNR